MAPAEQRAQLLSAYLLRRYAGNSLPVIGIALLSRQVGHLWANTAFAAVSIVLAAIALAIGMRRDERAS